MHIAETRSEFDQFHSESNSCGVFPGFGRRRWLIVGGGLLLGGCGTVKSLLGKPDPPAAAPAAAERAEPVVLEALLDATAQINPDSRGRPSPLQVRVYELKSAAAFSNADFITLYQRDQAELGGDVLVRDEYLIQPGSQTPIRRPLSGQTRFVAAFAAYRDLERARWRVWLGVPEKRSVLKLKIRLDSLAMTMALES